MKHLLTLILILTNFVVFLPAQTVTQTPVKLPPGYWTAEKSQAILDKTQTIRLAPDLSNLSAGERRAIEKLNEVGKIFQDLYELQRHPQSLAARKALEQLDKRTGSTNSTQNLLTLYRLFQSPIGVTVQNKREPFLPVDVETEGGGMYPADASKKELDAYLAANPHKRNSILDSRTLVRRSTAPNLQQDLAKLQQYPVLDTLHPGFKKELQSIKPNARAFYAVPYSIAYADEIIRAYALLNEAADIVQSDDEEFAGYLRNRSRDLLSDDYESGDAAWVTARFKNLNGQIGSYETYDDPLYGVKTYFSFNRPLAKLK
jgi:hypothetical protein